LVSQRTLHSQVVYQLHAIRGISTICLPLPWERVGVRLSTRFDCLGGIGLILALLTGLLVSEFRKWYRTRTVRLKIYERGSTYEERDRAEVCAWNEIQDITQRTIKIHPRYAPSRRISVIRSIVKADGTVIVLAETLNLPKLTSLITAGKSSAERGSLAQKVGAADD
jgi:hypothetical protein